MDYEKPEVVDFGDIVELTAAAGSIGSEDGVERTAVLEAGDIFYASVGTEHVAHPIGEARILVVEAEGSV